jgi:hypothetical protein
MFAWERTKRKRGLLTSPKLSWHRQTPCSLIQVIAHAYRREHHYFYLDYFVLANLDNKIQADASISLYRAGTLPAPTLFLCLCHKHCGVSGVIHNYYMSHCLHLQVVNLFSGEAGDLSYHICR